MTVRINDGFRFQELDSVRPLIKFEFRLTLEQCLIELLHLFPTLAPLGALDCERELTFLVLQDLVNVLERDRAKVSSRSELLFIVVPAKLVRADSDQASGQFFVCSVTLFAEKAFLYDALRIVRQQVQDTVDRQVFTGLGRQVLLLFKIFSDQLVTQYLFVPNF